MAALALDVTHPPGYPLLCLAGRLALLVPAGSPAFRTTLLASACAAAAVALAGAIAQALLRRVGKGGGMASLLTAGLTAGLPALFHQATLTEKYSLHLMLALVAILHYARGRRPYALAFTIGLGLAHHPHALFLLPLLWPLRGSVRRPPELALAAVLVLLPLSTKALYPAIRSQAATADRTLYAWGEPRTLSPLTGYLTVRQYRTRFSTTPAAFTARLGEQLAGWSGELPGIALIAAVVGAWGLWRAAPGLAGPLLLVLPGHAWLAGTFALPLHLAGALHLVPLVLAAIAAGLAPALLPCLLGPALAGGLALAGWHHALAVIPPLSKSRDTMVWDANRSMLALCPPHAILLAGMDNDLFPLRYFTGPLKVRPDVTPVDPPGQTKFSSWRLMFARTVPDGELPPGPDAGSSEAWHALDSARGPRCLVVSGFLESVVPWLLRFDGPVGRPAARWCGTEPSMARSARHWDRLALRSLRAPAAATARGAAITGVYAATLAAEAARALAGGRLEDAAALAAVARMRLSHEPAAWQVIGALALAHSRPGEGVAALVRAAGLAPEQPEGWARAALVTEGLHDWPAEADIADRAAAALAGPEGEALRHAATLLRCGPVPGCDPAAGTAAVRSALAIAIRRAADREEASGPAHSPRATALRTLADRLAASPARGKEPSQPGVQ